jgi:hypothetical protein
LIISGCDFGAVLMGRKLSRETVVDSVFTGPVAYMLPHEMVDQFKLIADGLEKNLDYIKERGRDMTIYSALGMLESAAVSTKHPGFCEEREWRAVSEPRMPLKRVAQTIETIGGIPKHVQSVRLQNIPEEGFTGLAPADLVNRVLIGPTEAGPAIYGALHEAMEMAEIQDIRKKLFMTNLPLRGPISAAG